MPPRDDPIIDGRDNPAADEATAEPVDKADKAAANRDRVAGEELVEQLKNELGALGLVNGELEKYTINLQLNKLLVEGVSEAERQRVEDLRTTALALVDVIETQRQYMEEAKLINDTVKGSFVENFTAIVEGTKSVKDAFRDMADDIVKQVNKLAAQKIADALFGGPGSTGGGALGGLFGGFDFGSWISGLFNFGGGGGGFWGNSGMWGMGVRAAGGPVRGNVPYLIGERGPEVFVPRTQGFVVPNNMLRQLAKSATSRGPVTIQVNQSATQYAAEIGLRTQRALARNT